MSTDPAPVLSNPIVEASNNLHWVLHAAILHHLPMPFAASAYDYTQALTLVFRARSEVHEWLETLKPSTAVINDTEASLSAEFEWNTIRLHIAATGRWAS